MNYISRGDNFWASVYGWMAAALTVTAVTAWYIAMTPRFWAFFSENPMLLFVMMIVQLAMVFIFTAVLGRLHVGWAALTFFLYAFTLGVTLSVIFKVYAVSSIYVTFFVSAGMFACMALYGFFTRTDLSKVGSLMIMVLFGLILSLFINLFVQSSAFDTFLSFIGVIVFALLTAYDMQKLRYIQHAVAGSGMSSVEALRGAFTLYLDFINLFLMLLRFTGKRNNE